MVPSFLIVLSLLVKFVSVVSSLQLQASLPRTGQSQSQPYQRWSRQRLDRRDFLVYPLLNASPFLSLSLIASIRPDRANAVTLDTGERIRRGAANLPGYGPTDVFFPKQYLGSWKMVRTSIPLTTTDGSSKASVVEYPVRFILSVDEGAVVFDRGFNQEQYLLKGQNEGVQSYEWRASNPNDLRWISTSGSRNEVKVTKRATDYSDFVSSSEFQRVTREDSRGIPLIEARRVLTKYKEVSPDVLEGIELVYSLGGGGDPMIGSGNAPGPVLLSKTRLRLERI